MRNLKKVLSLALALVMLLGMMVVGAGAATTKADLSEANQEAIAVLKATKVMTNSRYDDPVTRAEAAKMVLTIYNPTLAKGVKNTKNSVYFTDVKNHWAAGYIDLCFSEGIVSGRSKNVFDPNGTVTGYELGKMILKAMGSEKKYTGTTWTSKVLKDVTDLGLGANTKISNWDKPLPRLQAAQLTFNGLTKSVDGSTGYVVKGGEPATTVVFSSMMEAMLYQTNQDKKGKIEESSAKNSLAAVNFKLEKVDGIDDFGRTTNVWTMNGKKIVELDSSAPVKVYTTAITEKQFFADLGATGIKGQYDNYVVMDEVWYDGVKVATVNATNDGAAAGAVGLFANNAIIAKNDTSTVIGSGNGVTVEVYAGSAANHYKMVIVDEYAVTLTNANIVAATKTAKRMIRIDAPIVGENPKPRTFETEDFAAGDVVLYTMANGKIASMKLAAKEEDVSIVSYKGGDVTTSAGGYASNARLGAWALGDLGKSYDLYLDTCGNVIAKAIHGQAPAADVTTFAYILAGEGTPPTDGSITKADYTMKVRAVLADGTVGVYDVAVTKVAYKNGVSGDLNTTATGAAIGDYVVADTIVWDNDASGDASSKNKQSALNSQVFGYTLKDGKLTLSAPKAFAKDKMTAAQLTTAYANGANTIVAGKTALINGSTVFVVIDTGKNTAKTYTGSLKLSNSLSTGTSTWVVMTGANENTGIANVVFTTEKNKVEGAVTLDANYVYVDATTGVVSGTAQAPVYTYTGTDLNQATVTVTSDKILTTGVYGCDANGKVTEAKPASLVSIAGGMIGQNGTWRALSDSVKYIYAPGTDTANGSNCVLVTDRTGNIVEAVFVVSTPKAAAAPTIVDKKDLSQATVRCEAGASFVLPADTDITGVKYVQVMINGEAKRVDVSTEGWGSRAQDVMAFTCEGTLANNDVVTLSIKDAAGNNMFTQQKTLDGEAVGYIFWVQVVNTAENQTTVSNSAKSTTEGSRVDGQLAGSGRELAVGSYSWTITKTAGVTTTVLASGDFAITKN